MTSTSENYSFRQASNRDCEDIRKIVASVLAEYGLRHDPAGTDSDLMDLEEYYFRRGGEFYVALNRSEEIVGCFGLFPMESGTCELRKMYLLKTMRGVGLGRAMMNLALERARALGFTRIELETASQLKEAIAMYQKFGFRSFQRSHLANRCDQAFELILSQFAGSVNVPWVK